MSIKIDEVYERGVINTNEERAITLIDEAETLEKELSDIEYYKLIQLDQNNPGLEKH